MQQRGRPNDFLSAIEQTVESQLNPPIKNVGVKGLRHSAKEILEWPRIFEEKELRMNLFSLHIFIEIGGTGGGCFRYMYSRFLHEAARVVGKKELEQASLKIYDAGRRALVRLEHINSSRLPAWDGVPLNQYSCQTLLGVDSMRVYAFAERIFW